MSLKFLFNKKVSLKHRLSSILFGSEYSMFMLSLIDTSRELLNDTDALRYSIEELEKMLETPGGLYTTKYIKNVLWHIDRDSKQLVKDINEYMGHEVVKDERLEV